MGFLDAVLRRNKEVEFTFDLDLFQDVTNRVHMKKLAIDICVNFLARTISQSEFRIKEDGKYVKNELYYRLNVRPNVNQTASTFWQKVIDKFAYENECLIVQSDTEDLIIADSFTRNSKALYEDTFTDVTVGDFTFKRTFKQSEVLHLKYVNEKLTPLINSLFADYGDLFGRVLNSQKRKNQIRSTVKIDSVTAKNETAMKGVQDFIGKAYKAFAEKDTAIVPETSGAEYKEHFSGSGNGIQSVDEINKVTGGFFDQVAMAFGIPLPLIRGDMADVEKVTKNYMMYTVKPLLKKISDEGNSKFIEKEDYLNGDCISIRPATYLDIFDLATNIDKLRSSGVVNGNEIRDELGMERVDLPVMEEYFITKNYQEMSSLLQGGEKD